jgi:hypothetical protein
MRSRIAADIGFAEDLLWIYKIVRLGNEPSTPPASTWNLPGTSKFHASAELDVSGRRHAAIPQSEIRLAMSVVNARLPIRPSTAKLCRLKRLKNSGAM